MPKNNQLAKHFSSVNSSEILSKNRRQREFRKKNNNNNNNNSTSKINHLKKLIFNNESEFRIINSRGFYRVTLQITVNSPLKIFSKDGKKPK